MSFLRLSIAALLFIAPAANADELLCASKKEEALYFSTGQVRLVAEIASPTLLSRISLQTTGSDKLGFRGTEEVEGKASDRYVRFSLGGDAWCSYRLALPVAFMTKETTTAFLDAFCEEGVKSEVRLYCRVQ